MTNIQGWAFTAPQRDNYYFAGWYDTTADSLAAYAFPTSIAAATVIAAQWRVVPHAVKFIGAPTGATMNRNVHYGDDISEVGPRSHVPTTRSGVGSPMRVTRPRSRPMPS